MTPPATREALRFGWRPARSISYEYPGTLVRSVRLCAASEGAAIGARTGVLMYGDGDIAELLRGATPPVAAEAVALHERLNPGWTIEEAEGSSLDDGIYPPFGTTYAASFPGVDITCDQRVMIDSPSQLSAHLVDASVSRRLVLHAMHTVSDWLAFAVWDNGELIRALSLSPDSGILENIGHPGPTTKDH